MDAAWSKVLLSTNPIFWGVLEVKDSVVETVKVLC